MSEQLRINTSDGSSPVCIQAAGEIDLATVPELETALRRCAGPGVVVHLDLSEISFIDSTGLHALDRAYRHAYRDGWTFVIVNASEPVERLFAITGLTHWLGERSSV